jgi:hypothetical protein
MDRAFMTSLERAEKIMDSVYALPLGTTLEESKVFLAKELAVEIEEAVKEVTLCLGCAEHPTKYCDYCFDKHERETKSEAFEEAAKMLQEALSPWDGNFNRIWSVMADIRRRAAEGEKKWIN